MRIDGRDRVGPGVALRLAGGAAVLVDRGWAPSPDAFHVDQPAYREGDSAVVRGLGMLAPRARGDVDPAALRDSVPYRLVPFIIQQLPPATAPYRPLPPGLIRWPTPELSDGPHLSYAIQWFSFAVIIGVGSLALARKRAAEAALELSDGRGTIKALSYLYLATFARSVLIGRFLHSWAFSCAVRKEFARDACSSPAQGSCEGGSTAPASPPGAQAHPPRAR